MQINLHISVNENVKLQDVFVAGQVWEDKFTSKAVFSPYQIVFVPSETLSWVPSLARAPALAYNLGYLEALL